MAVACPRRLGLATVRFLSNQAYRRIADALADAIGRGELAGGTRLVPQREMANALGVDVTTVSRAMAEAKRRGLVRAQGRRGTFVAAPARERTDGGAVIDLSVNYPPPADEAQCRAFEATALEVLGSGTVERLLDYPHDGPGRHATGGALWCSRLGLRTDEDRITLAGGAQQRCWASRRSCASRATWSCRAA